MPQVVIACCLAAWVRFVVGLSWDLGPWLEQCERLSLEELFVVLLLTMLAMRLDRVTVSGRCRSLVRVADVLFVGKQV